MEPTDDLPPTNQSLLKDDLGASFEEQALRINALDFAVASTKKDIADPDELVRRAQVFLTFLKG